MSMASQKQRSAAKRNAKKAQAAAKRKQTLKKLPKRTKTGLGEEDAKVRTGAEKSRQEYYAETQRLGVAGHSKLGKADLKRTVQRRRAK
jgi:hypothetical protein